MKKFILAVVLTCWCSSAFGEDHALLYQISGKDLNQPSYLYGTFHLVCSNELRLSDATRKAMSDARKLYLELDFDDPSLQTAMIQAMMLTGGKNLKDLMNSDDYAVLDTYLQKNVHQGLAQMGMLKPIALLSAMYVSLLQCAPASYDLTFAQMAGQTGKEVLGLETVDQQMAVMDKVPMDQQLKELAEMARKPEEARKELLDLMAAYKSQDLDLLMKLMSESKFDSDTNGFEDELLNKRNENWIPIIEKAAHDQPTLFAFGAGHLGGTHGVIRLLRARGYTVKPLP